MIDWIYSKVAISIAVLVILAVIVGFFSLQQNAIEKAELGNMAKIIAFNVNEVSKKTDDLRTNVTFDEGRENVTVKLPGLIRNEKYTLTMRPDNVFIQQGDYGVSADFIAIVHPWNPVKLGQYSYYTNETIIASLDQANNQLKFDSGHDFYIHQKKLNINGSAAFKTFIYLVDEDAEE